MIGTSEPKRTRAAHRWGVALWAGLAALCAGPAALAAPDEPPPANAPAEASPDTVPKPSPEPKVEPDELFEVDHLILTGLRRTSESWLERYIDVPLPAVMTNEDARRIAHKIMTTGVFSDVRVTFDPSDEQTGHRALHVNVDEKWTTIPVARGVYGGGTPLRIFGLYDTHVLGELLTLGGEVRKYGDAPPGYVLYFRDPRGDAGRYYLGLELWREFRRRELLTRGGDKLGVLGTDAAMARGRFLTPIAGFAPLSSLSPDWKWGAEVQTVREAPRTFEPSTDGAEAPTPLAPQGSTRDFLTLTPTLLYDDVDLNNLELDGYRARLHAGPVLEGHSSYGVAELETFAFHLFPYDLNLAFRGVVGVNDSPSVFGRYFLGGLDSIRGLPDGAIHGSRAAFGNLELRYIAMRAHYLWMQGVVFTDSGIAGDDWHEAARDERTTVGVGVRFAIPQVYRLVLRIDYAVSVDGSGTRGITAGMSQFFDPYVPL